MKDVWALVSYPSITCELDHVAGNKLDVSGGEYHNKKRSLSLAPRVHSCFDDSGSFLCSKPVLFSSGFYFFFKVGVRNGGDVNA